MTNIRDRAWDHGVDHGPHQAIGNVIDSFVNLAALAQIDNMFVAVENAIWDPIAAMVYDRIWELQ